MILSDAAIERFSRQILLPEVGGRGQARLLTARVRALGSDHAATVARELLARAGVGQDAGAGRGSPEITTLIGQSCPRDITFPLVWGRRIGSRARAVTLLGRPCPACCDEAFGERELESDDTAVGRLLADAAAQALGALVAAEALAVLLGVRTSGREQWLDLETGHAGSRTLAGAGCPRCHRGA